MRRKNLWITLTLVNLCIVALLGLIMRTKFLFPIPWIDYRNVLSAHSHFAFGGWVTLALMILYIDSFLDDKQKQKGVYQFLLWGIQITSFGMLLSFPFQGYAMLSIIFSTGFIFFTYGFAGVFIRDVLRSQKNRSVLWLSIFAMVFLVLSSIGPFTLAYIMATNSSDHILFRDAVYTYLHFQYNGFFTLSVFAIFFQRKLGGAGAGLKKKLWHFTLPLCLSVVPALFLSLLWHNYIPYIRSLSFIGCALILLAIFFFARASVSLKKEVEFAVPAAKVLLVFSMVSFVIKMLLQTGTIVPSLGNAVFGYRPIIIGFLHLVFLGLVTFYILSNYIEQGAILWSKMISRIAVIYFSAAIIINEGILLVDGIGLMFRTTSQIYGWLIWIAAILLFTGALLLLIARSASRVGR